MRRTIVIAIAVLVTLVGATAAGAIVGAVLIQRGQAANFASDQAHWNCLNGGRLSPNAITCTSGDAEPYAQLSKRGIVVRVFNLQRACVKRVLRPSPDPSDPNTKPYYEYVYTFKPFGC